MRSYLVLVVSIFGEIFGTAMMKYAQGFTVLVPSVLGIVAYFISLYSLSLALEKIALSTGYAIWSGGGTALTAIIGVVFLHESVTLIKLAGFLLVIAGVVVLNLRPLVKKPVKSN
ncbi:hypothetical protein BSQ39_00865 [Loigolactobacillus backii]|uniref:DMT family transporter n=1 Tax=Loigolactobacillus backii TaxID=375175 RepID=UPI000C1C9E91|nr:multidrug efflux SMR transporter [Loigolactobacillus backii]PIO82210.1 hypothetical protein BSQ39_00865 [Loigolactobacillus backii]